MRRKRLRRLGALGLGVAVLVALVSGAASATSATGQASTSTPADALIVSQWDQIAQTETIPLRPTAHGQQRGMAMVAGAVYDAVNAIDGGHEGYLFRGSFHSSGSQGAAAATASYRVLRSITPVTRHPGLDAAYTATLATITDGPAEQEGIAIGEAAAAAMLASRMNDGFMAPFTPTIGTGPGDWRPLGWPSAPVFDPDGWVANLKPFLIESPSQFRSKGPDKLKSGHYARDYNEVKEIGAVNSTTRTADQTAAAVFWQFAPIAFWSPLARNLAERFQLDAADRARLNATVNLAGADGATSCWNDKYHWKFWRPRAAIQEGNTDGNRRTIGDPSWEPLFTPATATTPPLNTPPFPDHPSGHGCLSGAVLNSIADFFGSDRIEVTIVGGRTLNGTLIPARHFERLSDVLDEIIDARVWGGIHFRNADEDGAAIGKKVARYLEKHYFQEVD